MPSHYDPGCQQAYPAAYDPQAYTYPDCQAFQPCVCLPEACLPVCPPACQPQFFFVAGPTGPQGATGPAGSAEAPCGRPAYAYAANQGGNSLSVIDPVTHAIVNTFPLGITPFGLAADPALRRLYVTGTGNDMLAVDGDTGEVTARIPVGAGARFPTVNPNNRLVYVPLYDSGTVSVVNGFTGAPLSAVHVGGTPMAAVASPRTNLVYIANGAGTVPVINSNTNTIFAQVPLPDGLTARDLAADPCGNNIYVVCGDGSVALVNGTSNAVEEVFRPAQGAQAAGLDPGVGLLYLASGSQVLVYDLCTLREVGALPLASPPAAQPRRIAVNGLTHLVYITDTNGYTYIADGGTNSRVSAAASPQPYDAAVLNCEPNCPACGAK